MNVFVSYTKDDEREAKSIGRVLLKDGHQVKLQAWSSIAGLDYTEQIERWLKDCDWVVALLSPAYFRSKEARVEWQNAAQEEKLIPLLIKPCKIPARLKFLHFVDLSDEFAKAPKRNKAIVTRKLLAALRREPLLPNTEPVFGKLQPTQAKSGRTRSRGGARLQTLPPRSSRFCGRDAELEELRSAVKAARVVPVVGMSGVGKTQLALAYAQANRLSYRRVFWLASESASSVTMNFAQLATELRLPQAAASDARRVEAVREWLNTNDRWLIVYDNVATRQAAEAALAQVGQTSTGHVILTSEHNNWWHGREPVLVKPWATEVAAGFILSRVSALPYFSGTQEQACELARLLGGWPLVMEQAAAYLKEQHVSIPDLLAHLQDDRKTSYLLGLRGSPEYSRSAGGAWRIATQSRSVEARAILRLTSFAASNEISRQIFTADSRTTSVFCEAMRLLDPQQETPGGTDIATLADRALVELAAYSSVSLTPQGFWFHALLMTAQRKQLTPEEHRCWLALALRLFEAASSAEAPHAATWDRLHSHIERLLDHADGWLATQSDGEIAGPCVRLTTQLAAVLGERGLFDESERLLRRSLQLSEINFGAEAVQLIPSLHGLGALLMERHRLHESKQVFERAVTIGQRCEPESAEHAASLAHLGLVLLQMCESSSVRGRDRHTISRHARAHLERGIQLFEALPATRTNRCGTATAVSGLARVHQIDRALFFAERGFRRALQLDEEALGRDHPKVAADLINLAQVLCEGRSHRAEAEQHLRRALTLYQLAFGDKHHRVAGVQYRLASLLQETARHEEAEALYASAIRTLDLVLGPDHPEVGFARSNFGSLLALHGRHLEAEQAFLGAVRVFEATSLQGDLASAKRNLTHVRARMLRDGCVS